MTTLVFVHGWGFNARVWDGVIARLDGLDCVAVDLGFRGEGRSAAVRRPLVVGHSMGFAWALATLARPWAGAVAVNAFPRFTRAADFAEGMAPHRLARMRARFADDPAGVTAGFLADCGVAEPDVAGIRPGRLAEALAWLAECDQRAALAGLDCPLLALAGGADPLVSPAMSRAGFAGHDLDFLPEAGHLLPVTHPEALAARIRALATERS